MPGFLPTPLRDLLSRLRDAEGIALVEFAVALPLLLVLVVGTFDFGGAFNLRQKLDNVTREAARFAASQPTNDLGASPPPSVVAIRDQVDAYLQAGKINDCGLGAVAAGAALTWTATGSCPGGGTLTLTIDRGNNPAMPVTTVGSVSLYVISTHITISYPYTWQFNRVIGLLIPGANYGTTQIVTDAVVPNQD
jgi:Flp pilus assembly protein TadG